MAPSAAAAAGAHVTLDADTLTTSLRGALRGGACETLTLTRACYANDARLLDAALMEPELFKAVSRIVFEADEDDDNFHDSALRGLDAILASPAFPALREIVLRGDVDGTRRLPLLKDARVTCDGVLTINASDLERVGSRKALQLNLIVDSAAALLRAVAPPAPFRATIVHVTEVAAGAMTDAEVPAATAALVAMIAAEEKESAYSYASAVHPLSEAALLAVVGSGVAKRVNFANPDGALFSGALAALRAKDLRLDSLRALFMIPSKARGGGRRAVGAHAAAHGGGSHQAARHIAGAAAAAAVRPRARLAWTACLGCIGVRTARLHAAVRARARAC